MEPRRRGAPLRRLLPLAATLAALAIGLAGGYELRALGVGVAGPERAEGYAPAAAPPTDLLAAAFELALLPALDGGAEGQAFAYAGKAGERGRIELGGRFTTGFGAECREFTRSESRDGVSSRAGGLACRGADRSWNVMLLLPVAGSVTGNGAHDRIIRRRDSHSPTAMMPLGRCRGDIHAAGIKSHDRD